MDELQDDLPGAVVVTGGDRIFAAGADISEFNGPDEAYEIGLEFRAAFDAVAAIPRVTIAAVVGYALGGGCELALACDMRIASDNAKFGQPEVLLGIVPGGGGTQRLARLVGPAKAKDLILSGRQVRADEALSIGLVDEVVPASEVLPRALETAATFASGAVAAQALAKRAIDEGLERQLSTLGSTSNSRCSSRCSTPATAALVSRASASTVPARRTSPAVERPLIDVPGFTGFSPAGGTVKDR